MKLIYLDTVISILLVVCFCAHFFIGTQESLTTRREIYLENKFESNWIQLFNCWHLVSVDLFLYSTIYFLTAIKLIHLNEFRLYISMVFFGYFVSWIAVLLKLKRVKLLTNEQPHPFIFITISILSLISYLKH